MFLLYKLGKLQQYLPFTVLKPFSSTKRISYVFEVATVLTVYGIETNFLATFEHDTFVATVLTVYGIETFSRM